MRTHRVILLAPEKTDITKLSQRVSLEESQVLLGHNSGKFALFAAILDHLVDSLLKVASIDLIVMTALSSFDTLGLNKHSLTLLLVLGVMLGED